MVRRAFSRSVSWGLFIFKKCEVFLEVSLATFVHNHLICWFGLEMAKEPLSSFNTNISATFQLLVGFLEEKYADQDPKCKDDSADKVGEQKRELVK